jgi:hypothetical protein
MKLCLRAPAAVGLVSLGCLMLTAVLVAARSETVTVKSAKPVASVTPAPSPSAPRSAHPAPNAAPRTLPPGHPMLTPGTGASAANVTLPPKNITEPSATVPKGSVEIRVVDVDGKPLVGRRVRLGILHQSVAEGDSHQHKTGHTDANGNVRFDGLSTLSEISYRVTVPDGVATYAADPFSLKRTMGERVLLHIFPVTQDLQRALVGMRGVMYIEPREDVFQLEVLYSVYNIGRVTWVPSNIRLTMPDGFKAFTADDSMNDTRFVADGNDLVLKGTYGPGEYDVGFRFQLPNPHNSTVDLNLPLPPHVADMRVIVSTSKGMDLRVAGFPQAQHAFDRNGQRVLVTERQLHRGEQAMSDLDITLIGLPTPGDGRWYALILAIVFISGGLFTALAARRSTSRRPAPLPQNLASAHALLLNELVLLERAKHTQAIGPKSYDRTRRELLDALARLEAQQAQSRSPTARSLKAAAESGGS